MKRNPFRYSWLGLILFVFLIGTLSVHGARPHLLSLSPWPKTWKCVCGSGEENAAFCRFDSLRADRHRRPWEGFGEDFFKEPL